MKDHPNPAPNDWGPRQFETVADGQHYRLTLPSINLVLELDRIRRDRGDLRGTLRVSCQIAGAKQITPDGAILTTTIYPGNAEARKRIAGMITERAGIRDVDVVGLLEELNLRVEEAERTGTPPVRIRTVPLVSASEDFFDVHGLRLPKHHATMLYGMGDSLKSWITLLILADLQASGVPTLLIDYEQEDRIARRRLGMLYGSTVPDVLYLRADRPLSVEVERIARIVHDEDIKFVGIDSAAFGCGGAPEKAEEALAFMSCVRRLKVGSVIVAHQAKGENGDKSPFGSTFWFNSCRQIYHVKRGDAGLDTSSVSVALFPTKGNLDKPAPPVGLDFTFSASDVAVARRDVAGMNSDLASRLSLPARVRALLKTGAKTKDAIAMEMPDVDPDHMRRTINRGIKDGTIVRMPSPDGERFGLSSPHKEAA